MYWRGQYSPVNNVPPPPPLKNFRGTEPQLRRFNFLKALCAFFRGGHLSLGWGVGWGGGGGGGGGTIITG